MNVEMRDLEELDKRLANLGKVTGTKVMRQALFAATKPILDQAKANVAAWPHGSGSLHLSLGRRLTTKQRPTSSLEMTTSASVGAAGSRLVMHVGPRSNFRPAIALHNLHYKRSVKGIFHGHFLEGGHRIGNKQTGYLLKKGRAGNRSSGLGDVAARPFLKPALHSTWMRAVAVFKEQLYKRVERALKRQSADGDTL